MLKLLRVLPSTSRNRLLEVQVLSSSRNAQVRDFSTAARDTYVAKGYTTDRIFAPYYVYKGKAALSLSPLLPTFTKLDSGALVVDRRGSIMMVFTPAIGERKYDWERRQETDIESSEVRVIFAIGERKYHRERRQKFALSATEVGSLIAMGPQDSCEFFHDPSMLSSNAGQVRKSLSIKPHANSSGYFVSLTVVNNLLNAKENFNVPVTTAEFAVMKTACSFALPHIMGWDRLTTQQSSLPSGTVGLPSKVNKQVLDLEWDK